MTRPTTNQPPRRGTPKIVWLALVVVSVVASTPLIYFFHATATHDRDLVIKKRKRPVKVSLRPRKRRKPKKKVVKPKNDVIDGQVVDVREPEVEKKPKRSKYLAKYDNTTKKQTKAKNPSARRKPKKGAPAPKKESKVQSRRSKSLAPSKTSKRKQQKKQEVPKTPTKAKVADKGDAQPKSDLMKRTRTKALVPTLDERSAIQNLQAMTGSSSSDDALMEVPEGDETVLNTRRFQHWDFFASVKDRVRKHWHPQKAYRRSDPTGKVYGAKDRLTVVRVTLSPAGALKRLVTVKDSGNPALDEAARVALRKAAPFVNPPEGLIRNGVIEFKFGFLFEIGSNRFRAFRMR